jgi:hypothetical protein
MYPDRGTVFSHQDLVARKEQPDLVEHFFHILGSCAVDDRDSGQRITGN